MIKQVESKTSVTIKGRTFFLMWDDSEELEYPCNQCALFGELCARDGGISLVLLCSTTQPEPDTFFVEIKS